MTRVYTNLANGIHAMSQTTTPPNAPEVDVLAVIRESAHLAAYERKRINPFGHLEWQESADRAVSKVAELLTREAALVAERDALSSANIKYSEQVAKLIGRAGNAESERDALAAEVGALRLDAERWQTIRDSGSKITLRLHCTAPSERERFIDAVRAEGSDNG